MPATITNHSTAPLPIYQMVRNRLPFLADNTTNEQLISYFIYEVMWQLNPCFKLAEADIGDETKYSMIQKSIIADIVSVYILIMQGASLAGSTTAPGATFMSKTKAGSVEVEWSQFTAGSIGTLAMPPEQMREFFKKQAVNKALGIGCIIDICDDCSMTAQEVAKSNLTPFIVYPSPDCGCCGS